MTGDTDLHAHRRRKIYEGKAKILFEGPEPGTLVQHFKDDATAFNNQKHAVISGKGILNNRISAHLMELLGQSGIPIAYMKRLNMREQLIRSVEIIPVEVVVRNRAAGNFSKRFGVEDGSVLPWPLVEFYYKNDELGDPLVTDDHILSFGWAAFEEIEDMVTLAIRINDFLTGHFLALGLQLIDFKVEFGRLWGEDDVRLVLADEISPDTCRLWDIKSNERLDKDRFRKDLGPLMDGYQEVARRLGILNEDNGNGADHIPDIRSRKGDDAA